MSGDVLINIKRVKVDIFLWVSTMTMPKTLERDTFSMPLYHGATKFHQPDHWASWTLFMYLF